MITEKKAKEDFKWPDELVVMLRHPQTRYPHLQVVQYVPVAKVYMDEDKNVYEPDLHRREGGMFITLKLWYDKGTGVVPGYPIADDALSGIPAGFMSMFGSAPHDNRVRLELHEDRRKYAADTRTVFRTAASAHREWYSVLLKERENIDATVVKLQKWFQDHEVDIEEKEALDGDT